MKNPTVATLLNIIPGVGYLYLGTRRVFAILLLLTNVFWIVSAFDPALSEFYTNPDFRTWDLIYLLMTVTIVAAFMIDAYQEAVRLSKKVPRKRTK